MSQRTDEEPPIRAPDWIVDFLRASNLIGASQSPVAVPLAGGVSSDIWHVRLQPGDLCVKRALARLKVQADWRAPVERNHFEAEWMRVASERVPGLSPRVLAEDPKRGLFAMEYLDQSKNPVWKSMLRDGPVDPDFAARVGRSLADIHAATARDDELANRFATDRIFHELRLEPYLLACARRWPDLSPSLCALVERTARTRLALVHGDASPKNILVAEHGPVLLDAECAWYGDPAFDLAFCLNHLLLKCLWVPERSPDYLACFDALADAYRDRVDWESAADVERRAASLVGGLLLARVDGKSPVEYLTAERQRDRVRCTARDLLLDPPSTLTDLRSVWREGEEG